MKNNIFFLQLDDTFSIAPNLQNDVEGETLTYVSNNENILEVSEEGIVSIQPGAEAGDLATVEIHSSENGYVTSFFFILVAADGIITTIEENGITVNVKPDVVISVVRADAGTRVQIFDHADTLVAEADVFHGGYARVVVQRQSVIAPASNGKNVQFKIGRVLDDEATGTIITDQRERTLIGQKTGSTVLGQELKDNLLNPVGDFAYYGEGGYGHGDYGV